MEKRWFADFGDAADTPADTTAADTTTAELTDGLPPKSFGGADFNILCRTDKAYEFDIEEETAQAVLRNKDLLENIAVERIATELYKLLCGVRAEQVLLQFRQIRRRIPQHHSLLQSSFAGFP